jgi:hypothetical protein
MKAMRIVVIGLAVLLAGCGGATASPSATPPVTPSAMTSPANTPAPTPTPALTATPIPTASQSADLAALGATYTQIYAGEAAADAKCNQLKMPATNGTLADAQAIAQACRDGYMPYLSGLLATSWGPVQPQADNVIAAANAVDALVVDMINAPDISTFRTAYDQLSAARTALVIKAEVLREALGLPQVK